jgi:hypothetical protein
MPWWVLSGSTPLPRHYGHFERSRTSCFPHITLVLGPVTHIVPEYRIYGVLDVTTFVVIWYNTCHSFHAVWLPSAVRWLLRAYRTESDASPIARRERRHTKAMIIISADTRLHGDPHTCGRARPLRRRRAPSGDVLRTLSRDCARPSGYFPVTTSRFSAAAARSFSAVWPISCVSRSRGAATRLLPAFIRQCERWSAAISRRMRMWKGR